MSRYLHLSRMDNLSTMAVLTTLLSLFSSALSHGIPLVVSPGLNISTHPNITAHLPSCTNLTTAPSIPCYTKLNTTSYLKNFNLTKAEVCAPQQDWTECLLVSVYQVAGANCTQVSNSTSRCIPFDCANLKSTTCVKPSRTERTNITMYEASGWYAAWNVYSVHHHVYAWATALDKRSSENAILAAINPRVANTATSVLKALIPKYGFNPNADNAIVHLLNNQSMDAEPAYGNARIRGESNTLSGTQWRSLLYERLDKMLQMANSHDGFDQWLILGKSGAYSTRGLSGVDALTRSLRKGPCGGLRREC